MVKNPKTYKKLGLDIQQKNMQLSMLKQKKTIGPWATSLTWETVQPNQ